MSRLLPDGAKSIGLLFVVLNGACIQYRTECVQTTCAGTFRPRHGVESVEMHREDAPLPEGVVPVVEIQFKGASGGEERHNFLSRRPGSRIGP